MSNLNLSADNNPFKSPQQVADPFGGGAWPGYDEYYRQQTSQHMLPILGVLILPSVVLAVICQLVRVWNGSWEQPQAWLILVMCVAVTLLAYLVVANFVFVVRPGVLNQIRGSFFRRGINLGENSCVVAFSPGRDYGYYETRTNYDVGLVAHDDDFLVYLGEKTSWAIRRGAIAAFRLGEGSRELGFYPERIYVDWHDQQIGQLRTFNFAVIGFDSLLTAKNILVPALFQQLEQWRQSGATGVQLPPEWTQLPPPHPALPLPVSPRELLTGTGFLSGLATTMVMSAVAELVLTNGMGLGKFSGCGPLATMCTFALITLRPLISSNRS